MESVAAFLRTPIQGSVLIFACVVTALYATAVFTLMPLFDMAGDAPGYLEAMRILNGEPVPDYFTPNRILTTFLGVATVAGLSFFTGNYLATWFFVNSLYFFGLAFVSYFLFRRVTGSDTGAIVGALFVVGNYDVLVFGLNYLMEAPGWFFFMASLYATYRYIETDRRHYVWYAALLAGVGTLFKEYAFLGFAPLGLYLIYWHWRKPLDFGRALAPLAVALLPLFFIHAVVYLSYGYSYLDWYGMNAEVFGFSKWLWNASRSFLVAGSLLLPLAIWGAVTFVQEMRRKFDAPRALFVASLVVPALAVLAWPIITERLIFLAVPLLALLAAFVAAKHERHWPWFGLAWLFYVAIALRTDGYILNYLYTL